MNQNKPRAHCTNLMRASCIHRLCWMVETWKLPTYSMVEEENEKKTFNKWTNVKTQIFVNLTQCYHTMKCKISPDKC